MRLDHRLAAAGLMSVIFIAGGVAGGFATRAFVDDGGYPQTREWDRDRSGDRDRNWRGDRGGSRGGPPGEPRALMSSRAVEQIARRLDLSDEQRDSVAAILDRGRDRASAVFADIGPRLRTLLDSTNTELRAQLDSAQQVDFDMILQEDRGVLGRRFIPPDSTGDR